MARWKADCQGATVTAIANRLLFPVLYPPFLMWRHPGPGIVGAMIFATLALILA